MSLDSNKEKILLGYKRYKDDDQFPFEPSLVEQNELSKFIDKSIISFMRKEVSIFGWYYKRLYPESVFCDGKDEIRHTKMTWYWNPLRPVKTETWVEPSLPAPEIVYILSWDKVEVGQWIIPHQVNSRDSHLAVVSTVVRQFRLSFSDTQGYEKVPESVRVLDTKFKALTSRLHAYIIKEQLSKLHPAE